MGEDILRRGAPLPKPEARLARRKRPLRRSLTDSSAQSSLFAGGSDPVVGRRDNEGVLVSFVRDPQSKSTASTCMRPFTSDMMEIQTSTPLVAGQEARNEAVKKRANSAVMPLLLKSLSSRSELRFGSRGGGSVDMDFVDAQLSVQTETPRKDVRDQAKLFDSNYARIRDGIDERISFRSPQRCHSR